MFVTCRSEGPGKSMKGMKGMKEVSISGRYDNLHSHFVVPSRGSSYSAGYPLAGLDVKKFISQQKESLSKC